MSQIVFVILKAMKAWLQEGFRDIQQQKAPSKENADD